MGDVAQRSDAVGRRLAGAADPEQGSALLLAPAGLLILLVLAALCFDLTLAFQTKRQLVELADAAANDAVTFGLDEGRLRATGAYCLSRERAVRSVAGDLAATDVDAEIVSVHVMPTGASCPTEVVVTLRTTSPYPFSRAVFRDVVGTTIEARGRAAAVLR